MSSGPSWWHGGVRVTGGGTVDRARPTCLGCSDCYGSRADRMGDHSHRRQASLQPHITLIPDHLTQEGAYLVSRNPLYLGGALMWTGWSAFYGNLRIAGWIGLVPARAWAGASFRGTVLHSKFGNAYDAYRARVPRWIAWGGAH
jgi:hypothetical protein